MAIVKESTKERGALNWSPIVYTLIGLTLFNLVVYSRVDWIWEVWNYDTSAFLIHNIVSFAISYMLTPNKRKVVEKQKEEGNTPAALRWAGILSVALVLSLGTTKYNLLERGDLTEEEYSEDQKEEEAKRIVERARQKRLAKLPLVLRAVAKCYPIEDSDFNVNKDTGEIPAVQIYTDKGLLPWNDRMSCWESEITPDMLPVILAILEAPTGGEWSIEIKTPKLRQPGLVELATSAPKECVARANGRGKELPCNEATFGVPRYTTQVRAIGASPFEVGVVVKKK